MYNIDFLIALGEYINMLSIYNKFKLFAKKSNMELTAIVV